MIARAALLIHSPASHPRRSLRLKSLFARPLNSTLLAATWCAALTSCSQTSPPSLNSSTEQLCARYAADGDTLARAELLRRKAFTPAEWRAIDKQAPDVGMSTAAMYCALGTPTETHRLSAQTGQVVQFVYRHSLYYRIQHSGRKFTYVYAQDGKIISVQD